MTSDHPGGAFRGHSRSRAHHRVSQGLFRPEVPGLTEAEEFWRDLEAILLVLPPGAVFTHVTAARLLGWQLPALPDHLPVFAAVRSDKRPRRPGLICSRLTHDVPGRLAGGLPVDSPEEVLLRCARDLGVLDVLIMLDSARHHGHIDATRMNSILASRRPGVARLRTAWQLSDDKAESAGETLLRIFHVAIDIPVISQVGTYDADGNFLGRADLQIVGTLRIHEYDGVGHRDKDQHRRDLRRERRFAATRHTRCGYTLDDLLNHAAATMHEMDRALGRRHKPERLTRWRTLVAESLYADAGRVRVVNRWNRAMGVVEWSKTAS